jgi:hypothetical protein
MKIYPSKITQCLTFVTVLTSSIAYCAPDAESSMAAKKTENPVLEPENPILSVIAADLNGDKGIDSAMLLKSGDQADLYLYLLNSTGMLELSLVKKNLLWSGAMAGTLPQLRAAKNNGMLLYSQNDAIGRHRWHQRLSVDYRDHDFVVTGYTYDENDTLEPKANLVCDVNLLTGQGIKNKTAFKIEGQKIKLSEWSDEKIPKQCHD